MRLRLGRRIPIDTDDLLSISYTYESRSPKGRIHTWRIFSTCENAKLLIRHVFLLKSSGVNSECLARGGKY